MSLPINNLANSSVSQNAGGSSPVGTAMQASILDWLNPIQWVQYFTNLVQNKKNMDFAQSQFDYNKSLNQTLMDREDNQYQRTVKDMRAVGLNPLSLTSANTNSIGSSSISPDTDSISFPSSNMGSNLLHSIQLSNTLQDSRSRRMVESAQASSISADAKLKDVQAQLLEAELPEKSFFGDYYKNLTDEQKSMLRNLMYKKTSDEAETPGIKNEGQKLTNENLALQNRFLVDTFNFRVAQERLNQLKLLEQIGELKDKRAYTRAGKAKIEQEIQNLQKQHEETEQAIKNMQLQAKQLGLDISIKEQTKDDYIKAINQYNWNVRNSGTKGVIGPFKFGLDFPVPQK